MKKIYFVRLILSLIFLFLLFGSEISAKQYSLNTKTTYDFSSINYESNRNNDYDHDFYQYLNFSSDGYGLDNLSTYVSMRFEKGLGDTRRRDYFRDITDTYDARDQLKVYNAYARLKDLFSNVDVTVGRQYFYGAELAHFDGGRLDLKRIGPIDLSFFGGRRVTFYEYPERLEIWGGNFSVYPREGTKIAARVIKYIDFSYDFSISQTITPEIDFTGTYSLINNSPRELFLDLNYNSYKLGTKATISYARKLSGIRADNFSFNYTASSNRGKEGLDVERLNIGRLAQYQDYGILLHQRIYKGLGVGATYRKRELLNNNEGNPYNNDFDEFTAGLDWADFIFDGTDLLANWKYFKNNRNTKRFESKSNVFEGQLAQRLSDNFFVDAGAFYKVYDYNKKHIDTVGFSGDVRAYINKNINFKIRYAYEEDDPFVLPVSAVDFIQNLTVELAFKF